MSTNNEIQILNDMIKLSKLYYVLVDLQVNNKINEINNKLKELMEQKKNNIFQQYTDVIEEYDYLFGDFIVNNSEEKLKKVEKFINDLETLVKELCKHEYVYDLIDIDPEKSQIIEYCRKCNKTRHK
jgi:uncharacterized protein YutD